MALAAMGTYGLVSYTVKQSTHEIGIRMALGASGLSVVRGFLGRGLRLGAIGAALGIVAALGVSRLLGSVLFGVSATDAVSFARALAIVLGGVVVATIVPAWRAARTESAERAAASLMLNVQRVLKRDYDRYQGVRPIQIVGMVGYLLVVITVGNTGWSRLLTYQGTWDPVVAAALSMWAACAILSVFGLINPFKWLPIVLFEIAYKTIWLVSVVYPLVVSQSARRLVSRATDAGLSLCRAPGRVDALGLRLENACLARS